MPEVVLSIDDRSVVNDTQWNIWGKRFCEKQPPHIRRHILIPQSPSVALAKAKILEAIRAAGLDGTLIFNVGHGGAQVGSDTDGIVDLAPGRVMRIGGGNILYDSVFMNVWYDVPRFGNMSDLESDLRDAPNSPRLARWRVYKEIADACKSTKLYRVVFLTCNVGNAMSFVKKVANDCGVVIMAYKRRVEGVTHRRRGLPPRTVVFLEGYPEPTLAAGTVFAEESLPFAPSDTLLVGPPLTP